MRKLNKKFYQRDDVVMIARELIGKRLCTNIDGAVCSSIIVETEAYSGRNDKACHAYPNLRTARTEVMYSEGGVTYVYLCYGIHRMFNIVTNERDKADAILVRAVEPAIGISWMSRRRKVAEDKTSLTSGPGNLCKALGITLDHYGVDLTGDTIWIESGDSFDFGVEARKRVGVDYAEEDKDLPWRFIMKGNRWVSKRNFG